MQSAGAKINVTILRRALLYLCFLYIFLYFLSANTGPDTTTLVTRRDKPLRGNDSMSLVPVRIRNNLVPKYKQILSTNPFLSLIFFYIFLSLSLSFNHLLRNNYCNVDCGPFYGTGTKDLKDSFNNMLLGGTGDTSPTVYILNTFDKLYCDFYFMVSGYGSGLNFLRWGSFESGRVLNSNSFCPIRRPGYKSGTSFVT